MPVYLACGLGWDAPYPLTTHPSTGHTADVQILSADEPPPHFSAGDARLLHIDGPKCARLHLPNIAVFEILEGQVIRCFSQAPDELPVFIRAEAAPIVLHQREQFVLRGSAVEVKDGAMIFAGVSGAGKSTLAAGLHERGYRVLADNLSVIHPDAEGMAHVVPEYPHLELWESSLAGFGMDTAPLVRIRAGLDKYLLPLDQGFCPESRPVRAIYLLKLSNRPGFRLNEVTGAAKLPFILHLVAKRAAAQAMGLVRRYWMPAAALAEQVRIFEIERPADGFEISPLLDMVEKMWML